MGVTTKDLARICGVSRTTVTRALHGTGRISKETKQRIIQTAEELGYQPDLMARSLARGKSMCIGVIVVDLRNQYFPMMIDAMERQAKKQGYLLNITLHEQDKHIEMELLRTLVGLRVEGIIISSVGQDEAFVEYLSALPVPVVLMGNHLSTKVACVGINEYQAAKDATNYIIGKGYRNIYFVVPPLKRDGETNSIGHQQRVQGFLDGIHAHERHDKLYYEILYGDDYQDRALQVVKNSSSKVAFLCSGDMYAGELLFAMHKQQLTAPKDYGLMGFDKLDIFQHWSPALSTVDVHVTEVGETCLDVLLEMIQTQSKPRNVEIAYSIVKGESI